MPTKDEIEKRLERNKAILGVVSRVEQIMLQDPTVTEEKKVGIRILRACRELSLKLSEKMTDFADGECGASEQERITVMEYLELVNAGLDEFMRQHPIPEKRK